jgi:hypothetical protein
MVFAIQIAKLKEVCIHLKLLLDWAAGALLISKTILKFTSFDKIGFQIKNGVVVGSEIMKSGRILIM